MPSRKCRVQLQQTSVVKVGYAVTEGGSLSRFAFFRHIRYGPIAINKL